MTDACVLDTNRSGAHEAHIHSNPISSPGISDTSGITDAHVHDYRLGRPNSSLLFNATTPTGIPLPAAVTLHSENIQEMLRNYPDRSFVDTLCDIVTHGARIGYEGPRARVHRANHGSTSSNQEAVSKYIQNEVEKGRMRKLNSLPSDYFCSPIGVVPKKTDGVQTGWRVIFDLSCVSPLRLLLYSNVYVAI